MRLFSKIDNVVDRFDRQAFLTRYFDLAFLPIVKITFTFDTRITKEALWKHIQLM